MKNKDSVVLKKMLDYCNQVTEACNMFDNNYDRFVENSVFKNACCMCILQIGELCKLVSEGLRCQEKSIPWKEWCGIRDIFAHQYSNLDYQSAWDTIQNDLPEFRIEIERILKNGFQSDVRYLEFKPEVAEAMEEAKRISREPNAKRYTDIEESFEELNS